MKALYLLLGLNACHYLCDYVFVTKSMLLAKSKGKPYLPIFEHAAYHATLMWTFFYVFLTYNVNIFGAIVIQLFSHFVIDVIKGRLNKFEIIKNPMNKQHWWIFGLDQFLHQVVIILMVYMVLN